MAVVTQIRLGGVSVKIDTSKTGKKNGTIITQQK